MSASTPPATRVVRSRASRHPTVRQYDMGRGGHDLGRDQRGGDGHQWRAIRGSTSVCSRSTARFRSTKNVASTRITPWSTGMSRWKMARFKQVAGAGPGEDGLHEDRAAELEAELQPEHGEDLRGGVLDDVREHPSRGQSLGAQGQHELLAQDVERGRPHDARDDSERNEGQGHGGQHDVAQVLRHARIIRRAHGGQPVELHGEDDDEDDPRPVVRHRYADDRDAARQLVEQPAPAGRRRASPSPTPSPNASSEDDSASTRLLARASRTSRITGRRVAIDLPRSPWTTRPSQTRYCTGSGLSKP